MPETAWQKFINIATARGVKVRLEKLTDQIRGVVYTSKHLRKYIIINRDLPGSDQVIVLAKALEN